jgi:hypothetical protein
MTQAVCQCCGQPRAQLFAHKSKLAPAFNLLMCNSCIGAKYEPRFLIILHARKNGFVSVREYIQKHRYVGEPIKAADILI